MLTEEEMNAAREVVLIKFEKATTELAMTSCDIEAVLVEETEALLCSMRQHGFFYRGELRFDPTTWDINNGRCDDFAEAVAARVTGAASVPTSGFGVDLAHQVVLFGGRFYDAECHAGVARLEDLPIARNHGRSRADVIGVLRMPTSMAADHNQT